MEQLKRGEEKEEEEQLVMQYVNCSTRGCSVIQQKSKQITKKRNRVEWNKGKKETSISEGKGTKGANTNSHHQTQKNFKKVNKRGT